MTKKIILTTCFIFCSFLSPLSIWAQSVHILMPVYNTAPFLNKSLDSVFKQNYKDICLIAYNDGSTDDSTRILHQYKKCYPQKMVLLGLRTNKGISFARNALIEKSLELNPDAMILWLDSDDRFIDENFVKIFARQMTRTGADICLFNFKLVLEDEKQKANLNGIHEERLGHEIVLDRIWKSATQTLSPGEIDDLMNVSSIGWTKGYKKGNLPKPLNCTYEDFVYMAALYNANKITALPSTYKPIQYLRRSDCITGRRTEETFSAVIAQLERFFQQISPEKRELHKDKIIAFLKRKTLQYEKLLEKLVDSTEHPDITEKTLLIYRSKASELINPFKTCCEIK